MSIAANRFPKVRAALASSVRLAILSRQHNGSNVLCLGADFLSRAKVSRIVDAWLGAEFAGGRHTRRVRQLGRALKA
jgi:ribose 5-phosphate isomerase B